MLKRLFLLLIVLLLTILGIFLMKNDGTIEVTWFGYYIQASSTVMLISIMILIMLFNFLLKNLYRFYNFGRNYRTISQIGSYKKAVELLFLFFDSILIGSTKIVDKKGAALARLIPDKKYNSLLRLYIESKRRQNNNIKYDVLFEKNYLLTALNINGVLYPLKQAAIVDREKGLYNEALFRLEHIIQKAPDSVEILELIIDTLWKLQDWKKLIDYLKKPESQLLNQDSYKLMLILAYNSLGEFEFNLNNFSQAHKNFQSALDIDYDYNNQFALLYSAKSLIKLYKYGVCQKLILKNWSQIPFTEVVTIYMETLQDNNVKLKLKHLKQLLDLSSNNPVVAVPYVELLIQHKDFDEARELLLLLLKDNENRQFYDLLIQIEELSYGNVKLINRYKEKAESLPDQKVIKWNCDFCHEEYSQWKAQCLSCDNYGKVKFGK